MKTFPTAYRTRSLGLPKGDRDSWAPRVRNTDSHILLFLIIAVLMVSGCKKETAETYVPTPYDFEVPLNFPTITNIPDDNPMTVEGVELGRYLFYDTRLSNPSGTDTAISCGSCHRQESAFDFNQGKPLGVHGHAMPRTALPLINLAWNNNGFRWNGDTKTLEEDVLNVILNPLQFDNSFSNVVQTISGIEMYPPMFEKAFGDCEVSIDRIAMAISQFQRSLVSANSRFDRALRGEINLSDPERRGLILFTAEQGGDCFHCHGATGNPLFTTNLFYNNAKDSIFTDPADRYSVTGDPTDIGAYKATTMRNIALTGPYMHDGRFQTLEEVIDFYSEGLVWSPYASPLMEKLADGGAFLTPSEKSDLVAFLHSLTDSVFISDTRFSNPFTE